MNCIGQLVTITYHNPDDFTENLLYYLEKNFKPLGSTSTCMSPDGRTMYYTITLVKYRADHGEQNY